MRRYPWAGWHDAVSSNDHPYRTWEPATPYIDPVFRDCAIYLYPTKQDAREGANAGGSGFLVGMDSLTVEGECHMYAVTNEHVVRPVNGRPNPVIRLNDKDGRADILNVREKAWLPHPDGDDLAVTPLEIGPHHQIRYLDRPMFVSPKILDEYAIGPGDDCFMVGRLVGLDGRQRNEPVLRFGNLAMMPYAVLQPARRHHQESFLVEMRTLSGFSGSPVIVHYVSMGTRASPESIEAGRPYAASTMANLRWLLGVDWGFARVCADVNGSPDDRKLVNSGMSGVVPAWKLAELFDHPKLVSARERRDRELAAQHDDASAAEASS